MFPPTGKSKWTYWNISYVVPGNYFTASIFISQRRYQNIRKLYREFTSFTKMNINDKRIWNNFQDRLLLVENR